jgi:hypothetical protein
LMAWHMGKAACGRPFVWGGICLGLVVVAEVQGGGAGRI